MKNSVLLAALALVVSAPAADDPPQMRMLAANDPPQVRMLAANCANCHGTTGRASGAMPSLAGVDRTYFIEQMRQFRNGQRPATVMHQLAKGYSDDEVAWLAEFFARQPK